MERGQLEMLAREERLRGDPSGTRKDWEEGQVGVVSSAPDTGQWGISSQPPRKPDSPFYLGYNTRPGILVDAPEITPFPALSTSNSLNVSLS